MDKFKKIIRNKFFTRSIIELKAIHSYKFSLKKSIKTLLSALAIFVKKKLELIEKSLPSLLRRYYFSVYKNIQCTLITYYKGKIINHVR